MSLGIFKLDIDKSTEETLKNFIYSNTTKGGFNSFELNQNDIQKYSCIEKALHKLAEHNIRYMKNGNIEDFNVTFFTKSCRELKVVNIHADSDDLDVILNSKPTMTPVVSSVTYLSKSTNPIMITNIERNELYDSDDINNIDIDIDKNISSLLYYPDKYDHIIFEGGKYYHGEIPMDTDPLPFTNGNLDCECNECNECEERLILVIFIWKKKDLPIVPYYRHDIMTYTVIDSCFNLKPIKIDSFIKDIIDEKNGLPYENNDNEHFKIDINIKKVNIINCIDSSFNYKFYVNIANTKKHNLHNLSNICDYNIVSKTTNNRNEVSLQELNSIFLLCANDIQINDVFDLKTKHIGEFVLDYKLFEKEKHDYTLDVIWKNKSIYDLYPVYKTHNVELQINDKLLEDNIDYYVINKDNIFMTSGFLLDTTQKYFSPLEKLVYDIADSTLNYINIPFNNDIKIEFWIKTENDDESISFHLDSSDSHEFVGYNLHPFLSNIYYLNDNNDNNYTVVSSINANDLKFNNTNDKNICFILPRKNKLLTIFGGKNYHGNIKSTSKKRQLLILNYWYKLPIDSYYYYYKNEYTTELYEKNQHIAKFSVTRNYRTIYIDSEKMKDVITQILENKDKCENYIDLINKIDNTYDVTLFTTNKSINPTNTSSNYIEEEFNRLNKQVIADCTSTVSLNNTMKPSENIIQKSSILHRDSFDIYNYHIHFSILYITEAYINSLESIFVVIDDNIRCLELDYREQLDENMQKFIFKELILSVLDYIKRDKVNIQCMKIRKNITYNCDIRNNHIYIPLSQNIRITIESHQVDVLKGGFVDIKTNSHICIDSKEILLCIEYI